MCMTWRTCQCGAGFSVWRRGWCASVWLVLCGDEPGCLQRRADGMAGSGWAAEGFSSHGLDALCPPQPRDPLTTSSRHCCVSCCLVLGGPLLCRGSASPLPSCWLALAQRAGDRQHLGVQVLKGWCLGCLHEVSFCCCLPRLRPASSVPSALGSLGLFSLEA